MKRKRFSVEQNVAVLKQAEVGVPVAEIRQVGITEQTPLSMKNNTRGWRPISCDSSTDPGRERSAKAAGGGTDVG